MLRYDYTEVTVSHAKDDEDDIKEKQWWDADIDDNAKHVGGFTVSKSIYEDHFPNYYINTAQGEF